MTGLRLSISKGAGKRTHTDRLVLIRMPRVKQPSDATLLWKAPGLSTLYKG